MRTVSFADVVHQSIAFAPGIEHEALVLELIETRWLQRLRDISQTANTRLVYMFSEHSRFGHSLGTAYLACRLMERLGAEFPAQTGPWRSAVCAAALLHDIGHIAPGSHTAQKTWFPERPDTHEALAAAIIEQDAELQAVLGRRAAALPGQTAAILRELPELPPWTHELISGGGWNIDRGNWCTVDSILAGVNYGRYNIPALTDSIVLTPEGRLAIRENRLDAMIHFAVSRHAMYQQIYQHRVLLSSDTLAAAIVRRARDLGARLDFADRHMREALAAESAEELALETVFRMREAWWRYHLYQWSEGGDAILADLSRRMLYRRLFKTVRLRDGGDDEQLLRQAREAVRHCGYDPVYYLHEASTEDVHSGDSQQSMPVLMDDGRILPLYECEPLFRAMVTESKAFVRRWLVMPQEAKARLGRDR